MKVAVKKVDTLKRELHFEVPKERVSAKMEEVYKEIVRSAKIKGFRPGKAPRHIVEAEYGSLAKEETIKKIIPEAYQEGLEQEALAPLDYPEIDGVDWKDGVLKFKAIIEIRPEIKVTNYKGIEVVRKSVQVSDEELNKTLEYFQKGKDKDQKTEIDDAFVKGLGYPSLEAFKEALKRQMEIDKDRQNRMDVERQITDVLVKNTKMVVPQSLVTRQLEYRLDELKRRLKAQGLADDEIEKKENEMRKELKDPVEKDVKLFLIFGKIAQDEHIEVKQGENLPAKVMEFLMKEACWKDEVVKQA
jgi:trigger factor